MSDIKTGDVVVAIDPARKPAKIVVLSVERDCITGEPWQEPYILRPKPASIDVTIERPKRRPEIVSRPGRPTRWRR